MYGRGSYGRVVYGRRRQEGGGLVTLAGVTAKVRYGSRPSIPEVELQGTGARVSVRGSSSALQVGTILRGSKATVRVRPSKADPLVIAACREARVKFRGASDVVSIRVGANATVKYGGREAHSEIRVPCDKATVRVRRGAASTLIEQPLTHVTVRYGGRRAALEPEMRVAHAVVKVGARSSSTFISVEGREARVRVRGGSASAAPLVMMVFCD